MTTAEEWRGEERGLGGESKFLRVSLHYHHHHHILALDPNPNKLYTEQTKTPNLKVKSGDETQEKGREPSKREEGGGGSPSRVTRINKQGVREVAILNSIILKHLQN